MLAINHVIGISLTLAIFSILGTQDDMCTRKPLAYRVSCYSFKYYMYLLVAPMLATACRISLPQMYTI